MHWVCSYVRKTTFKLLECRFRVCPSGSILTCCSFSVAFLVSYWVHELEWCCRLCCDVVTVVVCQSSPVLFHSSWVSSSLASSCAPSSSSFLPCGSSRNGKQSLWNIHWTHTTKYHDRGPPLFNHWPVRLSLISSFLKAVDANVTLFAAVAEKILAASPWGDHQDALIPVRFTLTETEKFLIPLTEMKKLRKTETEKTMKSETETEAEKYFATQITLPRTTWMKTIHQDLRSNNLYLNEATDVAQNRPLWRL